MKYKVPKDKAEDFKSKGGTLIIEHNDYYIGICKSSRKEFKDYEIYFHETNYFNLIKNETNAKK